uniref:Uncharacterized protein n=1 Tax=Glossina austeni TaxID=7395 RepID=A0A1A9UPE7_GLOAU
MASLPNSQDAGNFSCIPVQTMSTFSMERCISNKTKMTSYAPPLSNSSSASSSTTSSSNRRTFSSSSSLALANVETIVSAPNAASTCSRRSIICDSMTSQRFVSISFVFFSSAISELRVSNSLTAFKACCFSSVKTSLNLITVSRKRWLYCSIFLTSPSVGCEGSSFIF